ncbi:bifunctional protein Aas [mine drainage metagenome]|uniref:Bifunctional protein Aas n=1 Tax=mine drainage metagenome TaxID=410659 RepID=A0A1J5S031_9ZZZZ
MKSLVRFILRLFFGYRIHGADALEGPGPMLLAPNHVSWIDWLLVGAAIDDDWRFVTASTTANLSWVHRRIMVNRRTFPVDQASPYAVREMADFIAKGGKLVLFPEGRISTSGELMKVHEGVGFLLQHTGARVVTAYLRGANRLRWVKHGGWTRWFPRVSVHFDEGARPPTFEGLTSSKARQKTTSWLRDRMLDWQVRVELEHGAATIPQAVAEAVSATPARIAFEDPSFVTLSYRRVAVAADLLASRWSALLGGGPGDRVGVLLPNANATPLTLLSLWETGRVPAILNFSSGVPVMLDCARLAGLKVVITSRLFLEKARIDPRPFEEAGLTLVYLEEVRASLGAAAKLGAALRNRLIPGRRLSRAPVSAADSAVVLFTSGSEGTPKGVELSHRNLVSNVRQISAVIDLRDSDRFFNALPLFHSFGLMAGVLFPLIRGCYCFLYPSPLHYRTVPVLVYDRDCTVLMGTNTFLNGYARKAHAYDFNSVRFLVAGAEKVQEATFDTWARKFGVRIIEGYGATECSPVIAANTRVESRFGSAGRFLPGVEHRLEPVEGIAEGGRLLVRGPNVMKGYLNADANERFQSLGGWYDTGDIVSVDEDGFVHILGRLKRFAKVSGEMVSLTAVEETLAKAFAGRSPRFQIAVVAVADAEKGERLIGVSNDSALTLADLRGAIREAGLSNLCAPRELRVMTTIPKLGTGKTDHRELLRVVTDQ